VGWSASLAVVFCALSASTRPATPVDPNKQAAIAELLSLLKLDQLQQQLLSQYGRAISAQQDQLEKSVSDMVRNSEDRPKIHQDIQAFEKQVFDFVAERIKFERMKPEVIKMCDESFTSEDLAGIIALYKSPAGVAYLQKLPVLTSKSVEVGTRTMKEATPELQKMTAEWVASMKKKYGEPAAK
jgi:hypothetical protein